MTSSSHHSDYHPYLGRLQETKGNGVWCTKTTSDRTDFLQVDMGVVHVICAVATQGAGGGSHVTSYKLFLSTDGANFNAYSEHYQVKVKKKRKYKVYTNFEFSDLILRCNDNISSFLEQHYHISTC